MVSRTIAEISRLDLQDPNTSRLASITAVKYLSSYNWIEGVTPTIAVPGSPPLWTAPKALQRLKKDSGLVYIAQNAARHPDSPLEPLFRSLYITNLSFDIRSIDVVTDRNNIRKLLSFVNPGVTRNELETFTINIEVTQNTAILCRSETATQEYIGPHDFRGFGHEFEKKYTTTQINGSTGHHRIISYCFCDLNFVVRHETDGYVKNNASIRVSDQEEPEVNSLSGILGTLSLSSTRSPIHTTLAGSKLRIENSGQVVPLESTLEIKTRTIKKPLDIREIAPQLWVSQTPKVVRAYHDRGWFYEPEVEDVAIQLKSWEAANQTDLRKLGDLIKKIILVVKTGGGKATIKYDVMGDKLLIQNVDGATMLPRDLYTKWDGEDYGNEENDRDDSPGDGNDQQPIDNPETDEDGKSIMIDSRGTKGEQDNRNDIPFFDVIKSGLDNGFRQFFRRMPARLSDYHVLCESLNVLAIDVLEGRQIRDLMADMRRGKDEWDPDERQQISGFKDLARDSAFRLLYAFLQEDAKDSNMAYNATLFVVPHRRIFRYRTRKMVREAFAYRFTASQKQQQGLDKWPIKDDSFAGSQEEDVTTEEDDIFFNSDSSF
ncbi:hypothetical protein TOPH_08989 [Tolypocladium ophioglossoides CBS 100239]|uniref:Geranylgeranyl pyrophosphate synthetase n=1 Tax=Tolypocladium ophioglossoides (strain CBS 100239) TaxID=1163406 RepID=A0A0L0MX76_TOLOC|nr:hypothetical protein TOPH_08989 [Tolypocladium ophioglossoides CBS 100239]